MINVALIIVHYKGTQNTLKCLDSLKSIKLPNIKAAIYITDNSPTKDLKSQIKQNNIPIKYIKTAENLGFAEGSNIGIRQSLKDQSEYVVLLNSDTLVSQEFLSLLVDFAKNPKIGVISPKIYFAPGFEYHKDKYSKKNEGKVIWYAGGKLDWDNVHATHIGVDDIDQGQYDIPKEVDFATGCCALIKREVLEKVGLLDKNYFLYFEDVDVSIRAKKVGFKVFYNPTSIIWHKNASSSGKPGSPLHIYYQTRNRFYFGIKYAPFITKLHLYKEAITTLFSRDKNQEKGAVDFLINNMGKGSWQ